MLSSAGHEISYDNPILQIIDFLDEEWPDKEEVLHGPIFRARVNTLIHSLSGFMFTSDEEVRLNGLHRELERFIEDHRELATSSAGIPLSTDQYLGWCLRWKQTLRGLAEGSAKILGISVSDRSN